MVKMRDYVPRLAQYKTELRWNGKEFAGHNEIAKKHGLKTYFTRPYNSKDKGKVENRIRLEDYFLKRQ